MRKPPRHTHTHTQEAKPLLTISPNSAPELPLEVFRMNQPTNPPRSSAKMMKKKKKGNCPTRMLLRFLLLHLCKLSCFLTALKKAPRFSIQAPTKLHSCKLPTLPPPHRPHPSLSQPGNNHNNTDTNTNTASPPPPPHSLCRTLSNVHLPPLSLPPHTRTHQTKKRVGD